MAIVGNLYKAFYKILLIVITFFTLYGQVFSFLPISISKIILIFYCPYIIYHLYKNLKNKINVLILIIFSLWVVSIILSLITVMLNGSFDISFSYSLLLEMTEFIFGAYLVVLLAKGASKDELGLMKLLSIVIFIQGIFIIWSFFSISFREFTDSILPFSGNIEPNDEIRMRGFNNSSGATASIVQAIGYLISLTILRLAKNWQEKMFFLIVLIVQFISILFTGRSGLIGAAFFTLAFPYISNGWHILKGLKRLAVYIILILASLTLIFKVFYNSLSDEIKYLVENKLIDYAFEPFIKGAHGKAADSQEALYHMMKVPSDAKTWIIGDGLYTMPDGANYQSTDSGYVRTLFFFGLTGSLFFYIYKLSSYIITIQNLNNRIIKRSFIVLLCFIVVMQLKETFMSKPELVKIFFIFFFIGIICNTKLNKV